MKAPRLVLQVLAPNTEKHVSSTHHRCGAGRQRATSPACIPSGEKGSAGVRTTSTSSATLVSRAVRDHGAEILLRPVVCPCEARTRERVVLDRRGTARRPLQDVQGTSCLHHHSSLARLRTPARVPLSASACRSSSRSIALTFLSSVSARWRNCSTSTSGKRHVRNAVFSGSLRTVKRVSSKTFGETP